MGRGATAFSPAYGMVPFSTPSGFAQPRVPRTAPPLQLTVMNLAVLGGAPGFATIPPNSGVPLTYNNYLNPGAGS